MGDGLLASSAIVATKQSVQCAGVVGGGQFLWRLLFSEWLGGGNRFRGELLFVGRFTVPAIGTLKQWEGLPPC